MANQTDAMEGGADSDSMRPWLISVVLSMAGLSSVLVGLRFVSRRLAHERLWWDDWIIIISMCWNLLSVGFFISAMYSQGLGFHASEVQHGQFVTMVQLLLAAEIMYAWNLCLTKVSVLLMFHRVFHLWTCSRLYLWAVGALTLAWAVASTFLYLFACVPVQKLWESALPGSCMNPMATWVANMVVTALTDLAIVLFPMVQLWGMKFRVVEQVGLAIVFAVGFLVVFTAVYRFEVLISYDRSDPTYNLASVVAWTEIEIAAGLIAACLPVIKPIITYAFHHKPSVIGKHVTAFTEGPPRRKGSLWPGMSAKKLSADSGRPIGSVSTAKVASNSEAWDWEQNVESLTRQGELCVFENNVVSQGRRMTEAGVETEEHFPKNGINITTEFRRWSVAVSMH